MYHYLTSLLFNIQLPSDVIFKVGLGNVEGGRGESKGLEFISSYLYETCKLHV